MKTIASFCAALLFLMISTLLSEQLSPEEDALLYQQIMRLSGETGYSISLQSGDSDSLPVKCGTPYILSIRDRVKYASAKTKQAWQALLADRYDDEAPLTYGSPGGQFLIHYAIEGAHSARIDDEFGINSITGVPVYVEEAAKIFDSVWNYEVEYLGYKEPPEDDFYPSGGDARHDVYLVDLKTINPKWASVYGVTYSDQQYGSNEQYSTAFQLLDNDYSEISTYEDRPLDALSVTAAHEFFHVIQFGYDGLEYEAMSGDSPTDDRHHWLEMTAVWMEDQVYDDINDYYYYLYYYLKDIYRALHTAYPDLFQYGATLWPRFLADKWGVDIIKDIWERCETFAGPNVFQTAIPEAIEEASGGEYDFAMALSEYYIWTYFTGKRARPGFGFDEAADFRDAVGELVQIPDSVKESNYYYYNILNYTSYPFEFTTSTATFKYFPQQLGAFYLRFSGFSMLDSNLTLRCVCKGASGSNDIQWHNRIVAFNPHVPTQAIYIDPEVYPDSSDMVFSTELLDNYDVVLVVLEPFLVLAPNRSIVSNLNFRLYASDSSEPLEYVLISDPYPNPYVISQAGGQNLLIDVLQPESQPVTMKIFTVSGERVCEKTFEAGVDVKAEWDGKNDAGETVASGMYLIYIMAGDVDKVCKVAIIE